MTNRDFTYKDREYQLTGITTINTSLIVQFADDKAGTEEERNQLKLHLGSGNSERTFLLKQANYSNGTPPLMWAGIIPFSWEDRDTVQVSISEVAENSSAAGTLQVTGTPEVGDPLTADTSGVSDANGLPATSGFNFQWEVTDANGDWSDIEDATGSDYVVGHSDATRTIRVTLTFTDQDGYEESITSGATANVPSPTEFFTLTDEGNEDPASIWSDGTTMYVLDTVQNKVFAYHMSRKDADSDKDIALDGDNAAPAGIWSDGTNIYIGDTGDGKLYAYSLADGTRDSGNDLTLHEDNDHVADISSDGDTMWALQMNKTHVYAYNMSTGDRDESEEFTLEDENHRPWGIHTGGGFAWIADRQDDEVHAYRLSTKAHVAHRTLELKQENKRPQGTWADGTTIYVSDDNAGQNICIPAARGREHRARGQADHQRRTESRRDTHS